MLVTRARWRVPSFRLETPLVMLFGLARLVFAIIAGIKADNGEDYKFPFSFNLIK